MSQVIIVSNRLPVSVKKEDGSLAYTPSIGGLAVGLSSFVKGRKNIWVGWPGIASDELTAADREEIVAELAKHNCSPVFLTKRQIDDFYSGYSNAVLWPLFHGLPFRKSPASHDTWWRAYRNVNRRFAEAVLSLAQADSRIWAHDYQLLLLPDMLRAEDIAGSIGLFLHTPFPDAKSFKRLPEARRLIRGMLGADLIGFHITSYTEYFLEACKTYGLGTVTKQNVLLPDRVVRVGDFPMGIDYQKYAAANENHSVKEAAKRYHKRYRRKKVIAAVDRMDPSKGLVERLQAYRQLLSDNPQLHGKVVFAMIAAPSRTDIPAYQELAVKLRRLVGDINKRFGTQKWQPVDYMDTAQPFEEVAALFSVADVAFIAPLRDGMNLAAKEFVASNRKQGILVLSETAGAAEELRDALLVNPRQLSSLVNGLQEALSMSKRELKSRLRSMQNHLAANTVHDWAQAFIDSLQQPVPGTPRITRTLNRKLEKRLLTEWQQARKRLILLDYDGSLVPFQEDYRNARPPKLVLELLERLSALPQNEMALVSGRSAANLESWFGHLPINLVAEHGAMLRRRGTKHWQTLARGETRWRRAILPVLERYARLTPGASVETKPHSLVWHYRSSPTYYAQKYAVTIKRVLKPIIKTYGIKIYPGHKILEIKDPRISKGGAAQRWLKHRYDVVVVIGDDFTDETMFEAAPADACTIKIGRGRTEARYRLQTYRDVRRLLHKLAL